MKSKELQGKKFGECLTIKNLRNGLRGEICTIRESGLKQ